MKCFELNIFAFLFQEIHLLFEIVGIGDKFRHHRKIIPIKQQLAKQLETKNKQKSSDAKLLIENANKENKANSEQRRTKYRCTLL